MSIIGRKDQERSLTIKITNFVSRFSLFIPQKYIFSYKHISKRRWDLLVLILAIQNSYSIPLQLSFKPPLFDTPVYFIFDNLVDCCFLVDILLMFSCSFVNKKGKEISEPKLIAIDYITSRRFALDSLSMLGASFISYFAPALSLFGFLKVTRVFRMGTLIAKANV